MSESPVNAEPEFTDTFERPAWWHRQQWLATLPLEALPQKRLDREWINKGRVREGLPPQRRAVEASARPVRCHATVRPTPKRSPSLGACHTYLVAADGSHLVKIGIAKNPMVRLRVLQTGQPMDLHLMWSVPGDYERALHARFARYRHRGEWFDLRELGDPVAVVTDAVNELLQEAPSE